MNITNKIKLNLSEDNSSVRVIAKQYDKDSREIECSFLQNGLDYQLSDRVHARVILKKADGKVVLNDALVQSNHVIIPLSSQMLSMAGKANCEVQLYQDESMLSTSTFSLIVLPTVYTGKEIESSDEYQAFINALQLIDNIDDMQEITKDALIQANYAKTCGEQAHDAAQTAISAATNTQNQSNYAKSQGDYAKSQGDYAKQGYELIKDFDSSSIEQNIKLMQSNLTALQAFQNSKNQANGLAGLDSNATLNQNQLPGNVWKDSGRQFETAANELYANNSFALNLKDSDLIGANHIYFQKPCTEENQGICFPKNSVSTNSPFTSDEDWMTLKAYQDKLWFMNEQVPVYNYHIGKILWKGSWSSGSITVPDFDKYSLFKITMIGQGTTVLAVKHGSNFRGTGGFSTAYPTAIDFYFSATASNNTLTLVACNSCRPKEDSYPLETMAVESITGIL